MNLLKKQHVYGGKPRKIKKKEPGRRAGFFFLIPLDRVPCVCYHLCTVERAGDLDFTVFIKILSAHNSPLRHFVHKRTE